MSALDTRLGGDGKPLPLSRCPTCAYQLDAALCPDDKYYRPQAGDLSVCLGCGAILRFDQNLKLAAVESLDDLGLDDDLRFSLLRAQQAARAELK